jgi:hypothetical protein
MYSMNQRVWVKSEQTLARVDERGWLLTANGRRAFYVVHFIDSTAFGDRSTGANFLTGSDNLRSADWACDGCDRWLPGQPHRTAPDGEYPNGLQFCFLCSAPQVLDPQGLGWNYR